MRPRTIIWPRQTQLDTMELLPVLFLLILVGVLIAPTALKYGHKWPLLLIAFPFAVLIGIELLNAIRRLIWRRGFDKVSSFEKLRPRLLQHPGDFRFQFRYWHGFDKGKCRPAIVIDDLTADERIAVYPDSWEVVNQLRQLGITEMKEA